MRTTQSLSVTLPVEMAKMVKAKVSSGEYATESEVVRDGLRTLQARDAAVEKWLREEVVPTYDAVMSGKEKVFSAEETADRLRKYMDSRIAESRNGATRSKRTGRFPLQIRRFPIWKTVSIICFRWPARK